MTHSEIERRDLVDRYLQGRLPESEAARFEEHYLACVHCQERLDRSHAAIPLIQEACRRLQARRPARWSFPMLAWGIAAAVGIAAVSISLMRFPATAPPDQPLSLAEARLPVVELTAFRSGDVSRGHLKAEEAARPFLLRLELRGLEAEPAYSIEIVDESGQAVWSAAGLSRTGDFLKARVAASHLPAGTYYVRVSGRRLLREYEFHISP